MAKKINKIMGATAAMKLSFKEKIDNLRETLKVIDESDLIDKEMLEEAGRKLFKTDIAPLLYARRHLPGWNEKLAREEYLSFALDLKRKMLAKKPLPEVRIAIEGFFEAVFFAFMGLYAEAGEALMKISRESLKRALNDRIQSLQAPRLSKVEKSIDSMQRANMKLKRFSSQEDRARWQTQLDEYMREHPQISYTQASDWVAKQNKVKSGKTIRNRTKDPRKNQENR